LTIRQSPCHEKCAMLARSSKLNCLSFGNTVHMHHYTPWSHSAHCVSTFFNSPRPHLARNQSHTVPATSHRIPPSCSIRLFALLALQPALSPSCRVRPYSTNLGRHLASSRPRPVLPASVPLSISLSVCLSPPWSLSLRFGMSCYLIMCLAEMR
jgi:hypothetical protein